MILAMFVLLAILVIAEGFIIWGLLNRLLVLVRVAPLTMPEPKRVVEDRLEQPGPRRRFTVPITD